MLNSAEIEINAKMSTIVGILTFICRINDWLLCFDLKFPLILGTSIFEPRCEKTGLRGLRPGPTQTGLYNHTRWLEA